jgi:hypothetical protein
MRPTIAVEMLGLARPIVAAYRGNMDEMVGRFGDREGRVTSCCGFGFVVDVVVDDDDDDDDVFVCIFCSNSKALWFAFRVFDNWLLRRRIYVFVERSKLSTRTSSRSRTSDEATILGHIRRQRREGIMMGCD